MAEVAIGIDLGTSNSCVAIARPDGVEVIPNAFGENTSASVVAFHDGGKITVGNAAKAQIIHSPGRTVYSSKRLIGRYFFSEEVKKAQAICSYRIVEGPNHSVRLQVADQQYSLPEISAMILREMKQVAEAHLGHEVTKAVVTVPAYFNDNQRQATKDAGRIAGLEVLRILNEPTAAALSYGFGKGLTQKVAIYDLGGGTFDISVLEIGTDVFEVLSTCGDTFLGGDDFDDRLIDLLADEFSGTHGVNLRKDPFAFEKLKVGAETAKKNLSLDDEVEIRIPDIARNDAGESLSLERRVAQDEFASLVMDLVMRTFKVCDEALQQANLTVRDLDGVILVGGPTRLPLIRGAVGDYFQKVPKTDVDPDEVVAMGASIHASSLIQPEQNAFLLDVTPLSLRIGVAGGLAETVIERNTPVPIEQTRTFTTFQDYQERVKIRVYQGESRQAEENERLGQFEFAGFRKARRGEVEIDVTFAIDSDGLVKVTACDRATGQQASTEITLSSGLSDEEIENIIERGDTERVHTPSPDDSAELPVATPTPPPVAAPPPVAQAAATPVAPANDEIVTLDDPEDDLAGDDELELVEGVETPPAEMHKQALDVEDHGAPEDPVPLEGRPARDAEPSAPTATASEPAESLAGDDVTEEYLGEAGTDLSKYFDDSETS
jgi:molecular chaperone DnaK